MVEQAVMRRVSRVLAQELSEDPEIGFIDQEAQADYRIFIKLTKLAEKSPRKLEADLELLEPADDLLIRGSEDLGGKRKHGKRLYQTHFTLSDVEDQILVATELALHIAKIQSRIAERRVPPVR